MTYSQCTILRLCPAAHTSQSLFQDHSYDVVLRFNSSSIPGWAATSRGRRWNRCFPYQPVLANQKLGSCNCECVPHTLVHLDRH